MIGSAAFLFPEGRMEPDLVFDRVTDTTLPPLLPPDEPA